jgi:4-hydroxybenzoate polyprenyltransferase
VKLRAALELGRVSNLPTVWTNVMAGVALTGAPIRAASVAALCLSLSLFYTGGMFLNDAFDREIDARERPERPIPSGRVTALEVFTAGFGQLAAGLAVLCAHAAVAAPTVWAPLISGLVLAGLIVAYDVNHKKNRLSPVVMGLCRVFVYVTAAVSVGEINGGVIEGGLVLLSYLIGLTYVARQENLREVRNLWPLGFLAIPFVHTAPTAAPLTILVFAGFLLWTANALSFLRVRPRANIPRAVVSLIAGISLLDAKLTAQAGHPVLAALAIGGFAATLAGQRYVRGT